MVFHASAQVVQYLSLLCLPFHENHVLVLESIQQRGIDFVDLLGNLKHFDAKLGNLFILMGLLGGDVQKLVG